MSAVFKLEPGEYGVAINHPKAFGLCRASLGVRPLARFAPQINSPPNHSANTSEPPSPTSANLLCLGRERDERCRRHVEAAGESAAAALNARLRGPAFRKAGSRRPP